MEGRHLGSVRARPVKPAQVAECSRVLAEGVEGIFDVLSGMAEALAEQWRLTTAGHGRLSTADLAALQPVIFSALDRRPEFDSAGYVMAQGSLADRDRYLEWWHRGEGGSFQPLILNLDPTSPDHYDYFSMEWFVAARDQGRRFVSGPLIDLPCADAHIMTFSQPVTADGVFLGIAGADVAMSRFEMLAVPPLLRLPAPSVVVNGSRRVIAGSDPRWASGDKLRRVPAADEEWQAAVPVLPDLGWVLAVSAD